MSEKTQEEQIEEVTAEQEQKFLAAFWSSVYPGVEIAGVRSYGYDKSGKIYEALWIADNKSSEIIKP